jgi:hypothetical protein
MPFVPHFVRDWLHHFMRKAVVEIGLPDRFAFFSAFAMPGMCGRSFLGEYAHAEKNENEDANAAFHGWQSTLNRKVFPAQYPCGGF